MNSLQSTSCHHCNTPSQFDSSTLNRYLFCLHCQDQMPISRNQEAMFNSMASRVSSTNVSTSTLRTHEIGLNSIKEFTYLAASVVASVFLVVYTVKHILLIH